MGLYRILNRSIAMFVVHASLLLILLPFAPAQNVATEVPAGSSKTAESVRTNRPTEYPQTRQVDVQDNYHGRVVKDRYRWLEDTESDGGEDGDGGGQDAGSIFISPIRVVAPSRIVPSITANTGTSASSFILKPIRSAMISPSGHNPAG